MGSVSRLRSEYRRARRSLRTVQETYDETIEELGDALSDMQGAEALGILAGLDRLEDEQKKLTSIPQCIRLKAPQVKTQQ